MILESSDGMIELNRYIKIKDSRNVSLFWHGQSKPRKGNIFETIKETRK